MDFGIWVFILGMLAFGYMGNPFMAIAFAIMVVVFFMISKETQHRKMCRAGLLVGIVAAILSVFLTLYSNYLTVLSQQLQAAQYEQYYQQMYGAGDDGGGYVVDPDGVMTEDVAE